MTPSSLRIDAGLWALGAAALALAAVLMAPVVLSGSDLYWHIAAGRWMIDNQQVLRINLFSYTFAGDPWQNQDWLAELMLAGAYVGAGWSGVLALTAAAAAAGFGLLALFLARGRRAVFTAIWLALAAITGAGAVQALPYLLALPCLVAWTGGLSHAGERGPSLKLLPLMLVWANLSSSFVIGLVLVGVLAVEAILMAKENRMAVARAWTVFAGFALVLSLVTPTGVVGLVHALRALTVTTPVASMMPLLVALPAVAMLVRRQPLRAGLVGVFFLLAVMQAPMRLFFAAAAPLLAAGPQQDERLGLPWRPLGALVMLAVVATVLRLAVPLQRGDDVATPQTALARVPAALLHQPVLNDRAFGGFLIFRDIKPFIDSRPVYAAAFRRRYQETAEPGLLKATLARYHVRWTILKPTHPAVKTLDGLDGWHRLYADQWAVVHVRNDAR